MSLIKQIANNLHSPFLLMQRALGDEQELVQVLRALRSFCIKNEVSIAVYADGRFCPKEGGGKNKNPHCDYVIQSLNAVGLREYFIEVAQYLNNQKALSSVELASMLTSCLLAESQKRIIVVLPEVQMLQIDLEIRRRYELNKTQGGLINWSLFLTPKINSFNGLLRHLNMPLRDATLMANTADSVLYDFATPLNEKQVMLLAISDICGILAVSAVETLSEFHVSYIDCAVTVDGCANYYIQFTETIAFALLKRKPAFLLLKDKANWALIVVKPELSPEKNGNLVIYKCGIATVLKHEFIDDVCSSLMKFIRAKQFALNLIQGVDIAVECPKTTHAAVDVLTALCISAFVRAYHASSSHNISQAIGDSIAAYSNALAIEVFVRTRMREFYAQVHTIDEEKNIDWISGNNNQMLSILDDMRSNAAKVIIQIIANYQPHPLYDVFGYDFSKRRMRLINELTDVCKDTEIWQIYGLDLSELKRIQTNNKLYQDLQLGLFLDKIFEESKLPHNVIARQIHPILLKIASAGQTEYKRHKQKLIASQTSLLAMSRRMQLVRRMFELLTKQFMHKNFIGKLEELINSWLACNREILDGMRDGEEREALRQEMIQILTEWLVCIQGNNIRNKVTLPIKISLAKVNKKDIGEFIGTLCYQKAHLLYHSENTVNISTLVYNKYNELLSQLPEQAVQIHHECIEGKRRKIQARRLLRIFEDYRVLHLRQSHGCKAVFDRALVMLHDPLIYKVLQPSLKSIVEHNEFYAKSWTDSPNNLIKTKEFGKFLHAVIKLSGVPKSQLRLNSRLLKSLDMRHYG